MPDVSRDGVPAPPQGWMADALVVVTGAGQGNGAALAEGLAELGARVLAQEHMIYPLALRLVASGQARIEGQKVLTGETSNVNALAVPAP